MDSKMYHTATGASLEDAESKLPPVAPGYVVCWRGYYFDRESCVWHATRYDRKG